MGTFNYPTSHICDMGKHPSRNDQRSNALNPNNAAFTAAADNRTNQMNPEQAVAPVVSRKDAPKVEPGEK